MNEAMLWFVPWFLIGASIFIFGFLVGVVKERRRQEKDDELSWGQARSYLSWIEKEQDDE